MPHPEQCDDGKGRPQPPSVRDEHLIALGRDSANEITAALGETPDLPDIHVPGYEITRRLHSGGQGIVFQAVHKTTGRQVAIKVLRGGDLAGQTGAARFRREIQLLAQLRHPSIVSIHDSGAANGYRYFVMDYVDGRPLNACAFGAAVPVRETLELFVRICDAVCRSFDARPHIEDE